MIRNVIFIFVILLIFSSCAKTPEKTDISDVISSETEYNKESLCGNGTQEEWEECDFEGAVSCSVLSSDLVGPLFCENCKIDKSYCYKKNVCDAKICSGNGICIEAFYNQVTCKCNEGYTGNSCSICTDNYHTDFDGQCISDDICTVVGCGNKNMECIFNFGKSECVCKFTRTGDQCEDCSRGYSLIDGECVGARCSTTDIVCSDYEKCDDSGFMPECVCKTENQDPDDCSKCLPDYEWVGGTDLCINQKTERCVHNTKAPKGSSDFYEYLTTTYTDETGWSSKYCDWKYEISDNNGIFIKSVNRDNDLMLFDGTGSVFTLNDELEIEKIASIANQETIIDAKILPDGNFYYINGNFTTVLKTPDGREIRRVQDSSSHLNSILTFTKGGRIFQGDIEQTFPFSRKIYDNSASTASSITVVDNSGNLYTVYSDGNIFSASSDGSARWNKNFQNISFSLQVALSKDKILFVPYIGSSGLNGIYMINNENGDIIKDFIFSSSHIQYSSIAIGDENLIIRSSAGYLKKYTKEGDPISSVPVSGSGYNRNLTPIILDNGNVYSSDDMYIMAFDKDLNQLWNAYSHMIFPYNNMIIGESYPSYGHLLFSAPGTPKGDWPQYLHDSMQSGSMEDIQFVDPPVAPVSLLPKNSAVFHTNSVIFSWQTDSGNPDIKYTLLLRDSTGYDQVYAGPETGLNSAVVSDLVIGSYEWRVVSQDSNGSLNVSDSRTFMVQ